MIEGREIEEPGRTRRVWKSGHVHSEIPVVDAVLAFVEQHHDVAGPRDLIELREQPPAGRWTAAAAVNGFGRRTANETVHRHAPDSWQQHTRRARGGAVRGTFPDSQRVPAIFPERTLLEVDVRIV